MPLVIGLDYCFVASEGLLRRLSCVVIRGLPNQIDVSAEEVALRVLPYLST